MRKYDLAYSRIKDNTYSYYFTLIRIIRQNSSYWTRWPSGFRILLLLALGLIILLLLALGLIIFSSLQPKKKIIGPPGQ